MAIIQCPGCGKNVSSTASECVHCGAKFSVCSECGKVLGEGVSICPECGYKLVNSVPTPNGDGAKKLDDFIKKWKEDNPSAKIFSMGWINIVLMLISFIFIGIGTVKVCLHVLNMVDNAFLVYKKDISTVTVVLILFTLFSYIDSLFTQLKPVLLYKNLSIYAKVCKTDLKSLVKDALSSNVDNLTAQEKRSLSANIFLVVNAQRYIERPELHGKNTNILIITFIIVFIQNISSSVFLISFAKTLITWAAVFAPLNTGIGIMDMPIAWWPLIINVVLAIPQFFLKFDYAKVPEWIQANLPECAGTHSKLPKIFKI